MGLGVCLRGEIRLSLSAPCVYNPLGEYVPLLGLAGIGFLVALANMSNLALNGWLENTDCLAVTSQIIRLFKCPLSAIYSYSVPLSVIVGTAGR